eukprot:CAMPEP_0177427658 /NCGR_PEP_ID=MMETSP0368-20130122/74170_1 /TAXON_ID=447022 ORGANISM="Scrippsiella hangoei-like, Strain SHHI-4" /NCGR_SAMPLE_ID=MMETSP0368 /ASSEMBLY_ACC=CAM_ASM_000363 /LENGTH=72 /DNA_ID=CAMNT_0018898059 /DNA_START=296 /DNA_END=511 /DNA_ORIENTATION=-
MEALRQPKRTVLAGAAIETTVLSPENVIRIRFSSLSWTTSGTSCAGSSRSTMRSTSRATSSSTRHADRVLSA